MSNVIMYHYIRSFDNEFPYFKFLDFKNFKKQNNFFLKKKGFIKITDNIDEDYYKDKYLLTFDDGLKEHLKVAKYLHNRNILGIFFIPSYQIIKKDFLPIHKIHLIFGKFNSSEIIDIYQKFKINFNKNKNVFRLFENQKKFLKKNKSQVEDNKKIILKTILNNIDQKKPETVNKIFNYCFNKKNQKNIFKNFYLNSQDIKLLIRLGMKIGGHSYNHKILSALNNRQQLKNIKNPINFLSRITQTNIKYFCLPYGGRKSFNKKTLKILKQCKIDLCFNVESKNWKKNTDKLLIPRYDCNEFAYGKVFKK